jgi:hypothetical protein
MLYGICRLKNPDEWTVTNYHLKVQRCKTVQMLAKSKENKRKESIGCTFDDKRCKFNELPASI